MTVLDVAALGKAVERMGVARLVKGARLGVSDTSPPFIFAVLGLGDSATFVKVPVDMLRTGSLMTGVGQSKVAVVEYIHNLMQQAADALREKVGPWLPCPYCCATGREVIGGPSAERSHICPHCSGTKRVPASYVEEQDAAGRWRAGL